MSKLIEILPNVYGVKVPSDANDFKIFFEFGHTRVSYNKLSEKEIPLTEYTFQNLALNELVNFKILGTLTKDEISFDASEIVEKCDDLGNYKNYKTNNFTFWYSKQSFRSALPEEIYFENPLKIGTSQHSYENYQTAQENITEKLLILQKLT